MREGTAPSGSDPPYETREIKILVIQVDSLGVISWHVGTVLERVISAVADLVTPLLESSFMSLKLRTGSLAVLSITGALVITGCTSGAPMVSLSFQAKSVEREVLDTGTQGSSGGDLVAGFGDLLDSDGQVIGHFDVVTTVNRIMEGADGRFVQAEYSFGPEGADSFIIIGAEQFATDGGLPPVERPATYAVTGGTGIYKGANGQCDVFRNDDPKAFTTTVNCSFSVL